MAPETLVGSADFGYLGVSVVLELDLASQGVTMTLTGPLGVWYGVGFGASSMAEGPYTVIVDGSGVQERYLARYSPGQSLEPTLEQVSRTQVGNSEVVVLRTMAGKTASRIPSTPDMSLIAAVGSGPYLGHHRARGFGRISYQ